MGFIETKKPKPNMNKEYMIDVVPTNNGGVTIYDISSFLEPYNGWERDNKINSAHHEIHGETASIYIIDAYKMLTRRMAIALAGRFINGDYDTYRLD